MLNEIIRNDDYFIIKLYKDKNNKKEHEKYAIIDIEDYEKCKNLRWSKTANDYVINRKLDIRLHHFVLNFDKTKGIEIDHINRNRLDCRKNNLRICNRTLNNGNRIEQSNNTSGYKGVWYDKEKRKWVAEIHKNKKKFFLGRFNNIEDAHNKYKEESIKLFGEFSIYNFEIPQKT